jgi:HK97 family phage major capsid protein
MSNFSDLKNQAYQYGNALHHARNEAKSSDPVSQDKVNKINNYLDETESAMNKTNGRPMVSSNGAKGGSDVVKKFYAEYRNAFVHYLRTGIPTDLKMIASNAGVDLSQIPVEQRPTIDSNGFQVTADVAESITQTLVQASVMRKVANVMTVSRDIMDLAGYSSPVVTSWGDGRVAAAESEPFARKTVRLFDLTAQPKVMQRMLDDAELGIENWIGGILSDIFTVEEDKAFFSGDGVNQPKGFLSYPDGKNANAIERIVNGDAAKITVDGLLKLQNSLSGVYEKGGNQAFIVSKSAMAQIRLLKDSNGQYLWNFGMMTSSNNSMFGVPVHTTTEMPSVAANADVVAYGNFKRGYQILNNAKIQLHRDPFSSKPFVVYYALRKIGGDVIDTNAIKVLKMA